MNLYVCATRDAAGCTHVAIDSPTPQCHGIPMRSVGAEMKPPELRLISGGV